MYRVVIDPGVFISALLSPSGAPAALIQEWLGGSFELVVCPHLLFEVETVLKRPKLRDFIDGRQATEFAAILRILAISRRDPIEPTAVSRDPKDDYLFALALEGGAPLIVSGDKDLLEVRNGPVRVLSPRTFLDLLRT